MQAHVRKRILRAFVARGHLDAHDAKDMAERAASFTMDRLKRRGADLVYRCGKGHSEPL